MGDMSVAVLLRERLFEGEELSPTIEAVDEYIRQQHIAQTKSSDFFDSLCIRASIACMQGEAKSYLLKMSKDTDKTEDEQLIQWYLEAMMLVQQGLRIETAILKFKQILRQNPHFVSAHLGLAAAYYKEEKYLDSFAEYKIVLERCGDACPDFTRIGLALCCIKCNKIEHARKCLERALVVSPDSVLATMALICVELETGNITNALNLTKKLYKLSPTNPVVIQKFVDYLFVKGVTSHASFRESVPLCKRLISLTTANMTGLSADGQQQRVAYARFQNGRLLHFEGKLEEAAECFENAMQNLDGKQKRAPQMYLAKVLYQMGKKEEAIRYLREIDLPKKLDIETMQMLSAANDAGRNPMRAGWYVQRLAQQLSSDDPNTWWMHGLVHRMDKDKCGTSLERAKELMERSEGGTVDWRLAAAALVTSPTVPNSQKIEGLKRILVTHIGIYEEVNNDDMIFSQTRLISEIEKDKELIPILYNIALLMININEDSEGSASSSSTHLLRHAQNILVAFVKSFPTFLQPYYLLAEVFFSKKLYQHGVKWLSLALTIAPTDGMSFATWAKPYFDNHDYRTTQSILRKGAKVSSSSSLPESSAPATLALGCLFLSTSQKPTDKAPNHLVAAEECFSLVLRRDHGNIGAAHGLSATWGLGIANASKNPQRCIKAERCMHEVNSLDVFDARLKEGVESSNLNFLVRSRSFKQAIDKLKKIPHQTSEHKSALSFCHAGGGDYLEALQVLNEALATDPENRILQYNKLLVMYAFITKDLSSKKSMTKEEGKSLHGRLLEASAGSKEFLEVTYQPPSAGSTNTGSVTMLESTMRECKRHVRTLGRQLQWMEASLGMAIDKGTLDTCIREIKDIDWRNYAKSFQSAEESAAEETRRRQEEEKGRMEELHLSWFQEMEDRKMIAVAGRHPVDLLDEGLENEDNNGDVAVDDGDDDAMPRPGKDPLEDNLSSRI